MQQYARTIGIVLITVLLVVAYVVLQPHSVPLNAALTRYTPQDATFALLLRRDFARDGTGSLAKRILQLNGAAQFIRTEWDSIENSLGTRVDMALWYFRAQSGTSGILLSLPASLSKDQTVSLTSKKYSLFSVNNGRAADATIITPSVIHIAASGEKSELHDELFRDRQAGAALYAISAFPRVIQEFAMGLGMNENAAIFPLTAYAEDLGGVIRLQMNSNETPPGTRMLDLMVPKDADIVLDGLPEQGSGTLSKLQPFAPVIAGLIHTFSETYSVPTSLITDQLRHSDALVLRDSDWMFASRSTTTLAEFASELMSWATPRIREGKLPDRTAYREYVRTPAPVQQLDSDGISLLFWGRSSATSTAQNGPDAGIYGLLKDDYMVIANRRGLLGTAGQDNMRELNFPQVAFCISGSELAGKPYSFFADFSKKNGLTEPIISIFGTNASSKEQIYLTCF